MNITVVGTGYVGLVAGACFSKVGNKVLCLDINEKIIQDLNNGKIHIYEPGLEEIIVESKKNNLIEFTTDKKKAYDFGEIILICVPTPQGMNGKVNLDYVFTAAKEIGENISSDKIVVDKSTVPVGTGKKVSEIIDQTLQQRNVSIQVDVISNPEFLAEGNAIVDFLTPPRICIGGESNSAIEKIKELYKPFTLNGAQIFTMDRPSAELAKYACNSMLATRVSFMNQFANLAELVGANIDSIREVMQTDPRIGGKFLSPGIGYGGSCFPKDVRGIINTASEHNFDLSILKSVDEVNKKQKLVVFNKLKEFFKGNLEGKKIAIWGLAFKKNTNDMRESPSIVIINALLNSNCRISAFDPQAMEEAKKVFGEKITYCQSMQDCLKGKEALAVLTEWDEFKQPDFEIIKKEGVLVIVDGRNIYNPEIVKKNGLSYIGIGKK
ncbi:MAG: UDP-glucose/GDP-mannose dehydrogenase family protein [archaeon]|jgi:UDPglucose 6-dehydrogenase